ncbi:MAG: ferrous iron transporter B [Methanophagales archaeon ANME-1-THS]|nr:MAG: ferrous iron transporter B [Methanophagales archaeon ANME-1-THS]
MKQIALMGCPNVGKSVVFSRLTGVNVISSNYPGTTVDFIKGSTVIGGEKFELIDVPGTYSLEPVSKAEMVAQTMLHEGDIVINVVDATHLERNLYLTLEILETKKPTVIALNMWDETRHLGIDINAANLEALLGVPVVTTCAICGTGIKELASAVSEAVPSRTITPMSEEERWLKVGEIIRDVQVVHHRHHTLWERFADTTMRPTTGIPLAILAILLMFLFIIRIGNAIIGYLMDPLFYTCYGPWIVRAVNTFVPTGLLHDLLLGTSTIESLDFEQSLGILTTGLYVPFGMVLPFIITFYFMLSLFEDSGYLPRLAVLVDTGLHKLGMHGSAIVPTILGCGCNVPGALATRILETEKQRFIAMTLMAITVPCMAQSAMIFAILGRYGMKWILIVYATLLVVYIILGLVLKRIVRGESPELLLEVPPYRRPDARTVLKKTWSRAYGFLAEAVPFVILGILIVNLLFLSGMIRILSRVFAPLLTTVLGLPEGAIAALILGVLRKDIAIGMLLPLGMTPQQLTVSCLILTMYFPCIATFVVLFRELGSRAMLKATGLMILVSLTVGILMRVLLMGI